MNAWDAIPVLLLALFSLAVSSGTMMVIVLVRYSRRRRLAFPVLHVARAASARETAPATGLFTALRRPPCWLAVKSRKVEAVQTALGLHHPKPCSWTDALNSTSRLFISPPFKGWILVLGAALPEPRDDVDICFRFLQALSRQLGEVQLFCADRVLHHHAWIQVRSGKVIRAYAWAGHTLWNQGEPTVGERDLGLRCFEYVDARDPGMFDPDDTLSGNVEKVPLLAARWSLDPASIEEQLPASVQGITGEIARNF